MQVRQNPPGAKYTLLGFVRRDQKDYPIDREKGGEMGGYALPGKVVITECAWAKKFEKSYACVRVPDNPPLGRFRKLLRN